MKLILKLTTHKKNKYFNAKPNMKKQLARSKIDSKFLNYLALFVRVSIHPYLHAKFLILLAKMLQSFHPNRPESTGYSPPLISTKRTACFGSKVIYNIYKDLLRVLHY